MKLSSLRFRLFLVSLLSILLALFATTFVLNAQFFKYFEDRVYSELQSRLEQLATNISFDADGQIVVDPLVDQRFEVPFSGLYWQVQEDTGAAYVSRSLWGGNIDVPKDRPPGVQFRSTSRSPIGTELFVAGWPILVGDGDVQQTLVLAVAVDTTEVTDAAQGFRKFLITWLLIMFATLLVAAWAQVRIGLAPLGLLRQRIETIRVGSNTRLTGDFPSEVEPLVEEVNELLDLHEASLAGARARASDLAHGLKTPLTVIRMMCQDMASSGQKETAAEIETQVSTMHHFIERELARAGTSVANPSAIPASKTLKSMVKSIRKFPGGADLKWTLDVPDNMTSPFDNHELSELLGNLLDNALKWASTSITVTSKNTGKNQGWLRIADDGPGIDDEKLAAAIKRGGRLDDSIAGTGLGLNIATDLVAQKHARMQLGRSADGGLEVTISWG